MEYEGIKYNLIDAPGLFDFEAGEYEGILASSLIVPRVNVICGGAVVPIEFSIGLRHNGGTPFRVTRAQLHEALRCANGGFLRPLRA